MLANGNFWKVEFKAIVLISAVVLVIIRGLKCVIRHVTSYADWKSQETDINITIMSPNFGTF